LQRYVEMMGQLQRVMAVVKVRGSAHSKELRAFEITEDGIVMGGTLRSYNGILTGNPVVRAKSAPSRARRKTGRKPR
jgi:circadian clock protein KaiC